MKAVVYAIIFIIFTGCCTKPTSPGVSPDDIHRDALLIAEQQRTIEQQQRDIERMGTIIYRGAEHIGAAEERLGSLEGGNISLEDWLRRVDEFVRAALGVQRELAEEHRRASGPDTDTGAGTTR